MSGLVLAVDPSHRSFVVSHEAVPGVMAAMAMPFDVREPRELEGVTPGMTVEFTLVLEPDDAYAEQIRIRKYEAAEQDPLAAQRLQLLKEMMALTPPAPLVAIGEAVPDFTLIDQARQPLTLSALRGKVVALNFVYTNCALPQFCFRMANHFGAIQRRFGALMGDGPGPADGDLRSRPRPAGARSPSTRSSGMPIPATWHFLTGDVPDVRRVCSLFGVQAFRDDGL